MNTPPDGLKSSASVETIYKIIDSNKKLGASPEITMKNHEFKKEHVDVQ